MRSGRIGTKVSESEVEGDEHPLLASAHGEEIPVVAVLGQRRPGSDGDVLVELDPHEPADSEWISCVASHAPYAAAARTSPDVSEG
ncbi:MAG: hypothetical protein ACRDUV_06715 [Pseudonocardiaceae bacterium]